MSTVRTAIIDPKREHDSWRSYYERTQDLPPAKQYQHFLDQLPQGACVLDLGAGTGRFTAAFRLARPDLRIEAMDNEPDSLQLLQSDDAVIKLHQPMQSLDTRTYYDAIWSNYALFFLKRNQLPDMFCRMAAALKPGGILDATFVMLPTDPNAPLFETLVYLTPEEVSAWAEQAGLLVDGIDQLGEGLFGKKQVSLPVFALRAHRQE